MYRQYNIYINRERESVRALISDHNFSWICFCLTWLGFCFSFSRILSWNLGNKIIEIMALLSVQCIESQFQHCVQNYQHLCWLAIQRERKKRANIFKFWYTLQLNQNQEKNWRTRKKTMKAHTKTEYCSIYKEVGTRALSTEHFVQHCKWCLKWTRAFRFWTNRKSESCFGRNLNLAGEESGLRTK